MNKVLIDLCGKPVIWYCLDRFERSKVEEIILVTSKSDLDAMCKIVRENRFSKVKEIIIGGTTRQESVYNGLRHATGEFVCVHDGARALLSSEDLENVLYDAEKYGAAALGSKTIDTLKLTDNDGFIIKTIDRESMVNIATPQVFKTNELIKAHEKFKNESVTDDCALMEKLGKKIKVTIATNTNIKLTTPTDLQIAKAYIAD